MIYLRNDHRTTAAADDGIEELQLPHESRYKELTEKMRQRAAKGN